MLGKRLEKLAVYGAILLSVYSILSFPMKSDGTWLTLRGNTEHLAPPPPAHYIQKADNDISMRDDHFGCRILMAQVISRMNDLFVEVMAQSSSERKAGDTQARLDALVLDALARNTDASADCRQTVLNYAEIFHSSRRQ